MQYLALPDLSPYFLAFIGAISIAVLECYYRYFMKADFDAWAVGVITTIGAGLLLLAILGLPVLSGMSLATFSILFSSWIFWAILLYCDVKAFAYMDASVNALLNVFRFVCLSLAAVILFKETLSFTNCVGLVIICLSILWGINLKTIKINEGLFYRALSIVSGTIAVIADKYLTQHLEVNTVVVCGFLAPGLLLILLRFQKFHILLDNLKSGAGSLSLTTLIYAISGYYFVSAFGRGSLGMTVSIIQSKTFLVFALSALLLGERTDLARRGVASLLSVVGVVLATL